MLLNNNIIHQIGHKWIERKLDFANSTFIPHSIVYSG